MKKKIFDFVLLGLGVAAIAFAIVCFVSAGNGELFSAAGSYSRMEVMLDNIVTNTNATLGCMAMGFGFTLLIAGGVLIVVSLKKILSKTED